MMTAFAGNARVSSYHCSAVGGTRDPHGRDVDVAAVFLDFFFLVMYVRSLVYMMAASRFERLSLVSVPR